MAPNQAESTVIRSQFTPKTLDAAETRHRDECENVIRHGWETFLDVGRALLTIRDRRLYRDDYASFEDYCRDKWEFSKTHANRLIEAAAVAAVLTPIGVNAKSESQLRPLARLSPQKIPAAWKKAQELAGDGEVTAKVVRRAAEEFRCDSPVSPSVKRARAEPLNRHRLVLNAALRHVDKLENALAEGHTKDLATLLAKLRRCLLQ